MVDDGWRLHCRPLFRTVRTWKCTGTRLPGRL